MVQSLELVWTSSFPAMSMTTAIHGLILMMIACILFSLKSPSNTVGPTKMSIKQNMCSKAMYHSSSYGPIFGGGHDFHIVSDANNNSNSCSNLGRTYELPPGQTNTFLVGSFNYKVSEIEVFQVI